MNKRVLLLIDRFWPTLAGAEVQATRLIRALRKRGYTFTVVTSKLRVLSDRDDFEGTPVHRLPFYVAFETRDPFSIHKIRRDLARLVEDSQPDLIHHIGFGPTVFFARDPSLRGIPMLFEVCGGMPRSLADPSSALGQAVRSARWVTAISNAMLDHVRELAPEVTSRSSTVHYGMEPPSIAPSKVSERPTRLLCVGRMLDIKGFDVAVSAFRSVLATCADARLTMAGGGEARQTLERQAHDLGISHAVTFVGAMPNEAVPQALNDSDIVVVPSRWDEPFGLIAVEAAFMARPVIASRAGALPELVLDGETGLTVPKENVAALAEAMVELITNPGRAPRLGLAARQRARQTFSIERYANDYERVYQRTELNLEGGCFDDQPRHANRSE